MHKIIIQWFIQRYKASCVAATLVRLWKSISHGSPSMNIYIYMQNTCADYITQCSDLLHLLHFNLLSLWCCGCVRGIVASSLENIVPTELSRSILKWQPPLTKFQWICGHFKDIYHHDYIKPHKHTGNSQNSLTFLTKFDLLPSLFCICTLKSLEHRSNKSFKIFCPIIL